MSRVLHALPWRLLSAVRFGTACAGTRLRLHLF
jgi:hypothetical protein